MMIRVDVLLDAVQHFAFIDVDVDSECVNENETPVWSN